MFRDIFGNRGPRDEYPPDDERAVQLPELAPVNPDEFIAAHESKLTASTAAWSDIAKGAAEREPRTTELVRTGMIDVWKANRSAPLPEDRILDRETDRLSAELTTYGLMVARELTTKPTKFKTHLNHINSAFLAIPDHTVNYIIRMPEFPTKRLMARHVMISQKMWEADYKAKPILEDLISTYRQQPGELAELAGMYEQDAAHYDRRYAELQRLIATDWHHPDPQQSALRTGLDSLNQSPQVLIPAFVRDVAETQNDKPMALVRDMARFALLTSGIDQPTGDMIRRKLTASYRYWNQFQDIDTLFATYVAAKTAQMSQHLATIAGPRDTKSIRTIPLPQQLEDFKANIKATYTPNRQQRRQRDRQFKKAYNADTLPDYTDIRAETQTTPPELAINTLVNGSNGAALEPTGIEDIITGLKSKSRNDKRWQQDARQVLQWLHANPVSHASTVLNSHHVRLAEPKPHRVALRRLAVNRIPGIGVDPNHRYMRIVYGLDNGNLIIADVLDHAEFDRKYPVG